MPTCRRSLFACAAVATIATYACTAHAQSGPPVALEWSAPDGCPDRAALLDDLAHIAPSWDATPSIVRGEVSPTTTGRWRVRLITVIHNQIGERTLDADSCAAVTHAAAAMLALALAPEASAAPTSSPPPTVSSSPPPEENEPSPHDQPTESNLAFAVFAGGVGDIGSMPTASAGLAFGVALIDRAVRFEVSGEYFAPTHAQQQSSGAGADVQLLAVATRVCAVPRVGSFELGPCAVMEVGAMSGAGTNVSVSTPTYAPWFASLALVAMAWRPTAHLALRLEAGPGVVFVAPAFTIDSLGEVFRPSPIFGRAALSLEVHF